MDNKRPAFILAFLCVTVQLLGQWVTVSGVITGEEGSLPFANVMVKGSAFAANANADGNYSLRLPGGRHEIIFQYIGYARKTETVELKHDLRLDVRLEPAGYALHEVEVKAGEDPAYPIIRKAMAMRETYLNQVPAYTCRAYVKGLQRLDRLPRNISQLAAVDGRDAADTNELKGVLYLSESETRYYYRRPDEKEIMFSSKVSGNNSSFSFNRLSAMKISFYKDLIDLGNIGSRPFVSPIAGNAFIYYRYYLLGTNEDNGYPVHKIKVVPKRSGDPCFSGLLYIQDGAWRLTGLDLLLTRDARISFVDSVRLTQVHVPLAGDSIWMPSSLNLSFRFGILGFQGSGYFNSSISDYDLSPKFPPGFFRNEVLKVEEGANLKDSMYWAEHRAIPLTAEEAADYRKKDSIAEIRKSRRYIDSVDRKNNRFTAGSLLLGYTYHKTESKRSISVPGLLTSGIQYNTVEGANLSYHVSIDDKPENNRDSRLLLKARYGISNLLWGGQASYAKTVMPQRFTEVGFTVKSIAEQFNREMPMPEILNTSYTLFNNENFMKLYRETGMQGSYSTELVNGLRFTSLVGYMYREPLRNSSFVVVRDDPARWFISNDPLFPSGNDLSFEPNNAFTIDLSARLSIRQKYYSYPQRKIIIGSRYPEIGFSLRKAIPLAKGDASYDLVRAWLGDEINAGLFGEFRYRLSSGKFLSAQSVRFMDYHHFAGNLTLVNSHDYLKSFKLLPYYEHSTSNWFTELHAEHHFNGLLFSYLRFMKNIKATEVVGGHFLATDRLKYYYEVNFGIEKIFQLLRFDFILAYQHDKNIRTGYTIGLNLSL